MRRADLEHIIRAAADVAQDDEIVVILAELLRRAPSLPLEPADLARVVGSLSAMAERLR